ncbi:glycosyltransferase family 39 protein [Paenibacillus nicotianae]|uniref:Glycosyltransferase family 39 protein n=1 Tax=Paenibacillus nicotianae TaxID=1526551 RepID=A0ABW4UV91_9BACL
MEASASTIPTRSKSRSRIDIPLILILILSAFLNVWKIWENGNANAYYTAAVTSMLQSFHNFFYASFDPGGFVTIDKPPVAFWVQTLFASIFGVHGWSVTLPMALAGVGSVGLIYLIVKPTFGANTARLAALMMAITPVAIAVQRSNNVDSLLVFFLLLSTWMLLKGVRQQKAWWIIAGFSMVGVAFNVKMLQAYMILPALYVFYLLAYKVRWKQKLSVLALGTVLLAGISVSWAMIVDSVPASERPYEGSSQTNSVMELAFGYNGLNRLTGQTSVLAPEDNTTQAITPSATSNNDQIKGMTNSQMSPPTGGRNTGTMFNIGDAGPLRLFQSNLSGQASLLLPFAILSLIALFAGVRRNTWRRPEYLETLFWVMWLLPVAGFFSIAGFFHQYYLIMLAPPVAVLAATGFMAQWRCYREGRGWLSWLLPITVAITTAFQMYVIYPFNTTIGSAWFYIIGAVGLVLTIGLLMGKKGSIFQANKLYLASGAIILLMLTPLYWSSFSIVNASGNVAIPAGGPEAKEGFGRFGGNPPTMTGEGGSTASFRPTNSTDTTMIPTGNTPSSESTSTTPTRMPNRGGMYQTANEKLLQYVTQHNTGEKYLFAVSNASSAAPYIIQTGQPVMAMGGFGGSDPILTVDSLKALISKGEIKYFMINGIGGRGGESNEVTTWIKEHGTEIPTEDWQDTTSTVLQNSLSGANNAKVPSATTNSPINGMNRTNNGGGFGGMMSGTLYEITPADIN